MLRKKNLHRNNDITKNHCYMKKFLSLFGLCAWAVGTIGGIGYSLYCGAGLIAACVAILAAMAFPTAKKWFDTIKE